MTQPLSPSPLQAVEREIAIRRRVHRLAEFYRHAAVFAIFMVVVWTANFILMQYWPAFKKSAFLAFGALMSIGWAIGLVCHAFTLLPIWTFLTQDWEDRKVRELIEQEQRRNSRGGAN
jgi:hypothetical protein